MIYGNRRESCDSLRSKKLKNKGIEQKAKECRQKKNGSDGESFGPLLYA